MSITRKTRNHRPAPTLFPHSPEVISSLVSPSSTRVRPLQALFPFACSTTAAILALTSGSAVSTGLLVTMLDSG